mgnify:CR=1 FL=1
MKQVKPRPLWLRWLVLATAIACVGLGIALMVVYALTAVAYLSFVVYGYRAAGDGILFVGWTVLAAGATLWRLTYREEEAGERMERRTMRFIGTTFFLLAAGIVFEIGHPVEHVFECERPFGTVAARVREFPG